MNILFCSVGWQGKLMMDFKASAQRDAVLVGVDNSPYAPALYYTDKHYLAPKINDPEYIDCLLDICRKEKISAVTTLIDPETVVLAENRARFETMGVEVLTPYPKTAALCFDKYAMYQHLKANGIPTVRTWECLETFDKAYREGTVDFPVFVKPRTGSGGIGAQKIDCFKILTEALEADPSLIVQEFMDCMDLDADVYIDTITKKAVSAFSKKKIEAGIGGASKAVSFKDPKLFDAIQKVVSVLDLNGPADMDFFYRDGQYYLSEIHPRFGGTYSHAYGAGVDFFKLIENNLKGVANEPCFGNYKEGVVMMMYDSAVICKSEDLACQEMGEQKECHEKM